MGEEGERTKGSRDGSPRRVRSPLPIVKIESAVAIGSLPGPGFPVGNPNVYPFMGVEKHTLVGTSVILVLKEPVDPI